MKVIELRLWGNGAYMKANERERFEATYCTYEGECKMYSQGKCVSIPNLFGNTHCPHAKTTRGFGLTKRARGFGKLSSQWREQYKTDIKTEYEFIRECGDYIFLPIAHLAVYSDKVFHELENDYFVPKELFTVGNIRRIITRHPRALMGGIIQSYQGKEVPKFIRQLKEFSPTLYQEYLQKYPDDKERFESICGNYIGRKAYLNTLNDGATYIDCHRNEWIKQDGYLVCNEYNTWLAIGKEKRICKQQIMGDEIVKITSNDYVSSKTVFVD